MPTLAGYLSDKHTLLGSVTEKIRIFDSLTHVLLCSIQGQSPETHYRLSRDIDCIH